MHNNSNVEIFIAICSLFKFVQFHVEKETKQLFFVWFLVNFYFDWMRLFEIGIRGKTFGRR